MAPDRGERERRCFVIPYRLIAWMDGVVWRRKRLPHYVVTEQPCDRDGADIGSTYQHPEVEA